MEVVKNFENKLLNRKEVIAKIVEKDPSMKRVEVKAQLAKKLKADEKLVVIKKINNHYGSRTVEVEAYVYDDAKTMEKLTPKHIAKRNAPAKKEGEEGEQ
jgi:ribosomal protein S24E